jgi:hypothetical protein
MGLTTDLIERFAPAVLGTAAGSTSIEHLRDIGNLEEVRRHDEEPLRDAGPAGYAPSRAPAPRASRSRPRRPGRTRLTGR